MTNLYIIKIYLPQYFPVKILVLVNEDTKIDYTSELFCNISYRWITQNTYKLYKRKEIEQYLLVLHLINSNSKNFTILFSHESSVSLGHVYPFLHDLSSTLKCNVICYDYSGYGFSRGTPSEEEVKNDIEEVGLFAIQELNIPSDELILMGHSLGMAPTLHLANNKNFANVAGLVLLSPISSGMSKRKDVFNNKDIIGRILSPIFLIHGKKDGIIPIKHSIELSRHIQNLYKWFPKKEGHNIITECRMKFFKKFKFFIDYLSRLPKPSDNKIYPLALCSNEQYNMHTSRGMQREENYMINNTSEFMYIKGG